VSYELRGESITRNSQLSTRYSGRGTLSALHLSEAGDCSVNVPEDALMVFIVLWLLGVPLGLLVLLWLLGVFG
jgi:hypothetical protein